MENQVPSGTIFQTMLVELGSSIITTGNLVYGSDRRQVGNEGNKKKSQKAWSWA